MAEVQVRRGDIWWVSFDPATGSEIKKTRPAIIVSNDSANIYLSRVQVVPATSHIEKSYPGEAYVTIKGKRSKAVADQLTTISKLRLRGHIGTVSPDEMKLIEAAVRQQLALS